MTWKSTTVAAVALLLAIPAFLAAEETRKPKEWPEVLVIDDFEGGLEKWENQDVGKLELVVASLHPGLAALGKRLAWRLHQRKAGVSVRDHPKGANHGPK